MAEPTQLPLLGLRGSVQGFWVWGMKNRSEASSGAFAAGEHPPGTPLSHREVVAWRGGLRLSPGPALPGLPSLVERAGHPLCPTSLFAVPSHHLPVVPYTDTHKSSLASGLQGCSQASSGPSSLSVGSGFSGFWPPC